MCIFYLIGLGLGFIGVFQTIMNGRIAAQCGFTLMALVNSAAGFILTGIYAAIVVCWPGLFPKILTIPIGASIRWWYFLPAIGGILALVVGPLNLLRIGAFPAVMTMLVGQLLTAFLWDSFAQGQSITAAKIAGLILTAGGAYLIFKN